MMFSKPSAMTLAAWAAAALQGVSAARVYTHQAPAGCEFVCGAGFAVVGNITFNIGEAVDFKASDDVCLATCEVVMPGSFGFHKSCQDVLPGSTKVSKNAGKKLCCMTRTCPSTTGRQFCRKTVSAEAEQEDIEVQYLNGSSYQHSCSLGDDWQGFHV
eukprot:TRINITY_DN828_c0_g1_i7.p1 TRINITY_DN828_c0_g1~~TRINITY_DN828_c0_g1_i7.p1  ORF type:complete len:158 (+),score=32.03 TRINITY_DN828_c0_g1_i7:69-542(+)